MNGVATALPEALSTPASELRLFEALRGISESRMPLRQKVLAFLKAAAPDGFTDEELWSLIPEPGPRFSTVTHLRRDLVRDGDVADSGRKRPTSSGCPATVWVSR